MTLVVGVRQLLSVTIRSWGVNSGVEDVSALRSADSIAVGVHLQEISSFVIAALLLSLFLAQVFVSITEKFRDVFHPIFRVEMNVNRQFLRLRLVEAIAVRPKA